MMRCYSELIKLRTFEERFKYLKLNGHVAVETFGYDRYMNQAFYHSDEWHSIRDKVILRDEGCDLAMQGHEIYDKIYIHHMNPITQEDIIHVSDFLIDPEYLICCRHSTHNAIHYGDESLLISMPVTRFPNDMCPWKANETH